MNQDASDGSNLDSSRTKINYAAFLVLLTGLAVSAILVTAAVLPMSSKKVLDPETDAPDQPRDTGTTRVAEVMSQRVMNRFADQLLKGTKESLKKQGSYVNKYLARGSLKYSIEFAKAALHQTHFLKRTGRVELFMDEKPLRAVVPIVLNAIEMRGTVMGTIDSGFYCSAEAAYVNFTLLSDSERIREGNMRLGKEEVHNAGKLECVRSWKSQDAKEEEEIKQFLEKHLLKYTTRFVKERLFKALFHHVHRVAMKF